MDTPMPQISRIEVIETGARRRWSPEEKQRILTESFAVPRNVSATARRYGLSTSQLFAWRRLARQGKLALDGDEGFVPVVVAPETVVPLEPVAPREGAGPATDAVVPNVGRIEIVLSHPRRLIVEGTIDAGVVARIAAALERG
jgi:transposase